MQSKRQSLIESFVNVAIGYGVALLSQIVVFPLFGIRIPLSSNLAMTSSKSSTCSWENRLELTAKRSATLLRIVARLATSLLDITVSS